MASKIKFEVYGKVQGVFFRKYTKKKADALHLIGWCENTPTGTVSGEASGSVTALNDFKTYLRTQGSPKSKIIKAEITSIENLTRNAQGFKILR